MIILIGLGISLTVFLLLFWFFSDARTPALETGVNQRSSSEAGAFKISSKDIETIAGDNVLTTQLDLARAYLESGRKNLAKNILNNVVQQGSVEQQQEAKRLLESSAVVS